MKFKDAVEEVRSRANIVDIIGAHVELRRAGKNLKGLCPFHAEKTPSFNVSADKQFFHCFGCGVGGSVFDFLMRLRKLSFVEALQYLAERVGVEIDDDYDSKGRQRLKQQKSEKDQLASINGIAADFFSQCLHDSLGESARDYLINRGLSEPLLNKSSLGFAPNSWDSLSKQLVRKGVSMKQAVALGLVAEKDRHPDRPLGYYDRFRNRIMFPIVDTRGRVTGFGGRTMGDDPAKYINSPASLLFDKSQTFYLLNVAVEAIREQGQAIVVEGYTDAICLHLAGLKNVVVTLGTALTAAHARLLSRYTDKVIMLFDGDEAGQKAAARTLEPMLHQGLDGWVVNLPCGEDPDSFVRQCGDSLSAGGLELQRYIDNSAKELLPYCLDLAMVQQGSSKERAHDLQDIAVTIAKVSNRFQRELFIKRFSEVTGMSRDVFEAQVVRRATADQQPRSQRQIEPSVSKKAVEAPIQELIDEEVLLVCLAFENETVYELVRTYEGPTLIGHPTIKQLLTQETAQRENGPCDVGYLLDQVDDDQLKQKIHQQSFVIEPLEPEQHVQAARDCMRKILKKRFEKRLKDLSVMITAAEERADLQQVQELLKQKTELLGNAQKTWEASNG